MEDKDKDLLKNLINLITNYIIDNFEEISGNWKDFWDKFSKDWEQFWTK